MVGLTLRSASLGLCVTLAAGFTALQVFGDESPAAVGASPNDGSALVAQAAAPSMPPKNSPDDKVTFGGTFRFRTIDDPKSFDSADQNSERQFSSLIHDHLVAKYRQGPPTCKMFPLEPLLAESWSWSADGKELVVKIREGAHFQDAPPVNGREVVAQDVVNTFKRMMKRLPYMKSASAVVDDIVALDKYRVQFKLHAPNAEFLDTVFAASPSQIVAVEAAGADDTFQWEEHVHTGNGPYQLEEFRPESIMRFTKNPNYWQKGIPRFDGVEIYNIKDENAALAALQGGRLDGTEIYTPEIIGRMKKISNIQLTYCAYPSSMVLWLANDKPPFNDVRVRRAVSMALNQDVLNQVVWSGLGTLRYTMVHGDLEGAMELKDFPPEVRQYLQFNQKQAKQLLAEAGYPKGLTTKIMFQSRPGTPESAMAEANAAMLAEVGIKVRLDPLDGGKYRSSFSGRPKPQYEGMALAVSSANTVDEAGYSYFHSSADRNRSIVNDPDPDKILEAIRNAPSEEALVKLSRDLQIRLVDQMYNIALPQLPYSLALSPKVKDVYWKNTGTSTSVSFLRQAWFDN